MTKDIPSAQEFLTVEDLAGRLRVPRSWVYSHSGDLGAYRLGKYLRFDWERVLERLPKLGQQPNDRQNAVRTQRVGGSVEQACNK